MVELHRGYLDALAARLFGLERDIAYWADYAIVSERRRANATDETMREWHRSQAARAALYRARAEREASAARRELHAGMYGDDAERRRVLAKAAALIASWDAVA